MNKIPSFCDSCCLIGLNNDSRYLLKYEPHDFNFLDQLQFILLNSFPKSNKTSQNIYSFTIDSKLCYTYNFEYNEQLYSIVLISAIPCPYIYIKFLKDMKESIEGEISVDPDCRLTLIWSTIQSWHFINQREAVLNFSNKPFTVDFDLQLQSYGNFVPYKYFNHDDDKFIDIWRALLIGRRILIHGDDSPPEDLSDAAYAIASLSGPFPYRENIFISQTIDDPRLYLKNDNPIDNCKLVSVPELSNNFGFKNDFDFILKIERNSKNYEDIKEKIQKRNQRVYSIVTYMLKRKLIVDPYSDLIEKEFIDDNYNDIINNETQRLTINKSQITEFKNTETFKLWRRSAIIRDDFREIFLSTAPELALYQKDPSQLHECMKFLDLILSSFKGDNNVAFVVRKHKKVIKKLLRGEKVELPVVEDIVLPMSTAVFV